MKAGLVRTAVCLVGLSLAATSQAQVAEKREPQQTAVRAARLIDVVIVNVGPRVSTQSVGVVEAGRMADIIAVNGDLLKDLTNLERVEFVMKGGQVIKDNIRPGIGLAR